jgi:hypothetical protein
MTQWSDRYELQTLTSRVNKDIYAYRIHQGTAACIGVPANEVKIQVGKSDSVAELEAFYRRGEMLFNGTLRLM